MGVRADGRRQGTELVHGWREPRWECFHVRWAREMLQPAQSRPPSAAASRNWCSAGCAAACSEPLVQRWRLGEEGICLEPPGRFPKQRDCFLCWSATRATRSSSPRDISLAGKWNPILRSRCVCFDLRCVLSETHPLTASSFCRCFRAAPLLFNIFALLELLLPDFYLYVGTQNAQKN